MRPAPEPWTARLLALEGRRAPSGPLGYAVGALVVALATALAGLFFFDPAHLADAVMLYLLGVVVASLRLGSGPSLFTALLSVAVFDFVFIPPFMGFVMTDVRHLVTLVVMLVVAVLISRLAAIARRTAQARVEAEQERLRNALLSSVSHDLRTPLAAIEGATSTLLDLGGSLDEPTRRELLETAHEETRRLTRRVANLLDMTRVEAGALCLNLEWQPVEEVVGTTLAQMDELLAGRAVTTRLPESLPPVRVDAVLLGTVLANLLENAVKYAPPGTGIDIEARARGGEVALTVSDTGPGVDPGAEASIFDRFRRAAQDGGAGGVGLGLAICRAIVEAHGGRIWCENRPEGGAAFTFTLLAEPAPGLEEAR